MPRLVCVVDHDDETRATVALALRAMNFEVIEIADSRDVQDVLAANPVDAVIIDIIMPNKDGIEVIAEVRNRWPNLRIVAISAGGRIGPALYLEIASQLGANACLRKPIATEDLLKALGGEYGRAC